MNDRKVIACNLLEARDAVVPTNAKCYLSLLNPGGGHDRVQVLARSRSGRPIVRWEDTRNLQDFRIKTLPPKHPLYDDHRIWDVVGDEVERLEEAAER